MVNKWLIKPIFAEDAISGLGIKPINREQSVSQLEDIISSIIGFITIIAFVFFVFQVIFAGYSFISAHGDEKKLEAARSKLTNGILGLTLVVIAFGFTAFLARILGLGNIFNLQQFFPTLTPSGLDQFLEASPTQTPSGFGFF